MNKFKKVASATVAFMTLVSMSGIGALAPMMASAATIVDGDVIKTADNFDVYIVKFVGAKKFKRLVLNPQVFESYGHLKWENIKIVSQAEMDVHTTSELVRADGDTKVYKLTPNGDMGSRTWIQTAEAFVAAGYDWDSVYTINSVDRDNYSDGSTGTTGFSVALASDTSASKNIPATATHVEYAKFTFTGNATINNLTLTRSGIGSSSDFDNVYLYDGVNRLTNGRTVNSSTNKVVFNSVGLVVSGSRTITVVADVSGTSGNMNTFEIASASDISGTATLGGNFPVRGNSMAFAGSTAGTVTIAKTGSLSNPYVGASQAAISQFTLQAATEDGLMKNLTLYNGGNLAATAITNLNLKIGGNVVATGVSFDSNNRGLLTFSGNGLVLSKGTTYTATLYADLGGRPDDTLKLYVENDVDVYAVGQSFGYGMQVTKTSFDTVTTDTHNLTMQGGQLTIAFNGPTATTVGTDTNDSVMLDFSVTAASDIEVRQMRFYICYIDTVTATMELAEDEIEDVKISEVGGTTLLGPVDGSSFTSAEAASVCAAAYTGGETYYTFTDSFTMSAGETKHLQMTADMKSVDDLDATDIIAGLLYNPGLLSNSVKYQSSGTYLAASDIAPSTSISGNNLTLSAASIAVALGTDPTGSKTYVKGATKKDAMQILFTAGDASDMTLTDLTLTTYVKDEAAGTYAAGSETSVDTMYAKDIVANVYLYDGETLVSGPKAVATNGDVVFSGLTTLVAHGTQKALTVKIDLSNTAPSGTNDYINFDIEDTTDVSANDSKGTVYNPASVDINDTPTVQVLKTGNGTLTTAVSTAYTPLSSAIHMSQQNVEMSKVRFTAATEAFTVQTLEIEVDASADRTNMSSVTISYPTQSGATETKTGFFGSATGISFSGLNFYVPKDNYAYLTVYANMKAYTEGGLSGTDFSLDFDGDATFKAVGEGGTVITESHAGVVDANGSQMYLYRSFPKVAIASSPAGGSGPSVPTTLMKFSVTNMGEFDLTMDSTSGTIKFEVVASGAETGDAVFTLYDDTTGQILDAAAIVAPGDPNDRASATFDFTTLGVTLSAGQTKNFRIDLTSGGTLFNENGDSLQLVLRDDAAVLLWNDNSNMTTQVSSTATVNGLGYPATSTPVWGISGL